MTKARTRHAPDGRVVDSPLEGLTLHIVEDFGRLSTHDVRELKARLRLADDPETDLRKMETGARRILQKKKFATARLAARPHTSEYFAAMILENIDETRSAIARDDARAAVLYFGRAIGHWWLAFFKRALERDLLTARKRSHNQRTAVSKPKHIPAVQAAVAAILARNPRLSARRVFDEIPDGDCGRGVDVRIDGLEWNVYRDGDEVVAYDFSTRRERKLKRKTPDRPWRVLERYVRRHREGRPPQQFE
jgi:hypothetical protein